MIDCVIVRFLPFIPGNFYKVSKQNSAKSMLEAKCLAGNKAFRARAI